MSGVTTDLDPTRVDRAESDAPLSRRRERTRERLLDAAYGLFAEHGINGTSIEAVCEAAGFTRGAFYSNFESKESLFLALTEREIRTRMRNLEAAVEHLPDDPVRDGVIAPDTIAAIVAAVMADPRDERRWCLMSAELELLALRDPQVAARFADQEESFRAELAGILTRVLTEVGMRFAIDPAAATRVLISAYTCAARDAFLSPAGDDAVQRAQTAEWLPALVGRLVEPLPAAG
ncbi:helix-turn-helix domain-containing protein [Cellulosimicrobium funkei]|uniref:TetR/AcrR family transcriptional regulator n=1 Tax=Cellulosimicrobium funkei TaxID=264251 RepID=UPI0004CEFF4C